MKKLIPLIVASALSVSTLASAESNQYGGFNGPNGVSSGFTGNVITVAAAKNLSDDAWVTLQGNIIQRLSKDNYMFQDSTGQIKVDIDYDKWNGQTVSPTDLVEITGEVDKDWNSIEIDVKNVRVIKTNQ